MNMRDDLKAFVDNELSEERRTEILRRLETDSELQAEVIALRQMSRTIREEAWQPEPVGLERTLAALERPRTKTPWWYRGQVGWALGTASLAALAICFFPRFTQLTSQSENVALSLPTTADRAEKAFAAPSEGSASSPLRAPMDGMKSEGRGVRKDDFASTTDYKRAPAGSPPQAKTKTSEHAKQEKIDAKVPALRYHSNSYLSPESLAASTDLQLEVEDVHRAKTQVLNIAKQLSGRLSADNEEKKIASASSQMQLQVPSSHLGAVVEQINRLGRPLGQQRYVGGLADTAPVAISPDAPKPLVNGTVLDGKVRNRKGGSEVFKPTRPEKEATLNLTFVEKQRAQVPASAKSPEQRVDPRWAAPVLPLQPGPQEEAPKEEKGSFDPVYALLILPLLFLGWLAMRAFRRP